MDIFATALITSATTVAIAFLMTLAFRQLPPKKVKWKACTTCGKYSKV